MSAAGSDEARGAECKTKISPEPDKAGSGEKREALRT